MYISAKEVESKVDIVDLINKCGVELYSQNDDNYMGKCPFHFDRNPSLSVSRSKKVYHCFGCGASGNMFTFFMKLERVTSFKEAVRKIAEISNIKLSKTDKKEKSK